MCPKTKKGDALFGSLLKQADWAGIFQAATADAKATLLVEQLNDFMDKAYPKKHKKIRSTDNPWIDSAIRNKIRGR